MNNAGFSRRYGDTTAVAAPITGRQSCSQCGRRQSVGQYGRGETVYITCRPKHAGWRRGDLEVVQFKEVA